MVGKGNKSGQCFPEELRSVTKNPWEYWNWSPLHWRSVDFEIKPIENNETDNYTIYFHTLILFGIHVC